MLPFRVNEDWYENYWYSDHPSPRRRSVSASVGRFALAVCLVMALGGAAFLSHSHHNGLAGYEHDASHIRLM
jgi:hypothetical protein